jgi:hypothetical protein
MVKAAGLEPTTFLLQALVTTDQKSAPKLNYYNFKVLTLPHLLVKSTSQMANFGHLNSITTQRKQKGAPLNAKA